MNPVRYPDAVTDPVDLLNLQLEQVWDLMCTEYEISVDLPSLQTLFAEGTVDLSIPYQAAKSVVANMLLEVMEQIGRFSPWYKMPARAFGLASVREGLTGQAHWTLAPEAVQKWQAVLEPLAISIRKSSGLIQAILLVEGLMVGDEEEDPELVASCLCFPPRTIKIRRSVLDKAEILCDACLHAFA